MLALYRSSRQADALETFQEARRARRRAGARAGAGASAASVSRARPAIAGVPSTAGRQSPRAFDVVRRTRGRLAQVAGALHEHRLVTLTGAPGVGKSRLAVEAARSLEAEFQGGIWLVDFARAGGADDAVRLLARPRRSRLRSARA